jgi:hypothetical protein
MMPREMTPMCVQDGGFQHLKVEGLIRHFLLLHRMMRRTLALRIGYSEVIPAYERNLLDALMKPVRFDIFEYIVDEIWNIAINPLRSCGFAPYIQFTIEYVAQEKFYKNVRHDSLRPAVSKDPRTSHAGSSAAHSRTTHSGGAPLYSCYQLRHLEDALRYLCHMPVHRSASGCDGSTPSDCAVQSGDYSQLAGRSAPGVP